MVEIPLFLTTTLTFRKISYYSHDNHPSYLNGSSNKLKNSRMSRFSNPSQVTKTISGKSRYIFSENPVNAFISDTFYQFLDEKKIQSPYMDKMTIYSISIFRPYTQPPLPSTHLTLRS